jgi:predicted GIY-YIG superfamily endonuclease
VGTVYLLHFDTPYWHARHYIGWTENLDERLEAHRNGTGANLMWVIKQVGIGFQLARQWNNASRRDERRIKNLGGASRMCPVCTPGTTWGRFRHVPRASKWSRKTQTRW